MKYPRTPYWPYSPQVGVRDDTVHPDPEYFVNREVVVTEKLDGSNVMLHRGQAYGRSMAGPSTNKWMAMVKKHHAWKLTDSDLYLYGEDIYGVHSIAYAPVREDETFYAFALRDVTHFHSVNDLLRFAHRRRILSAPVLYRGTFASVADIHDFFETAHAGASTLGGEREGVVMRVTERFPAEEFARHVCKSVRQDHVQTDEHWTRNWRPCALRKDQT